MILKAIGSWTAYPTIEVATKIWSVATKIPWPAPSVRSMQRKTSSCWDTLPPTVNALRTKNSDQPNTFGFENVCEAISGIHKVPNGKSYRPLWNHIQNPLSPISYQKRGSRDVRSGKPNKLVTRSHRTCITVRAGHSCENLENLHDGGLAGAVALEAVDGGAQLLLGDAASLGEDDAREKLGTNVPSTSSKGVLDAVGH